MMRRCIELARSATKAGNTAVGCVITLQGHVVAEAEERSPAGIREADGRMAGACRQTDWQSAAIPSHLTDFPRAHGVHVV
jgi:pyrimidine deaminase RibD-like protein